MTAIGKSAGIPGSPLTYLDVAFSSAYTQRWHMVRSQRNQSLAEHSARVAYMFQWLLNEWCRYSEPAVRDDRHKIEGYGVRMALCHDMVETLTGDMPSHVKVPAVKQALQAVELEAAAAIDDRWPLAVLDRPDVDMEHPEWAVACRLVKLADICETYLFALGNQGCGYGTSDYKRQWILTSLEQGFADCLTALAAVRFEGDDNPVFPSPFLSAVSREWVRHFGIQPQHL